VVLGRPNVGKSTLVNRIVRRKAAVTNEEPGVTRDRRQFEAEWAGHEFHVVDTGGWEARPKEQLASDIREQAEVAVSGADLVVFVADATTDVTDDDMGIARVLQRSGVPYLLAANKVDSPAIESDLAHLWGLGLGTPIPVSALAGRNAGEFLDRVLVSDIPGTTRDPINMVVDIDGEFFEVIDTAGIKRRTRIKDDADYYSVLRAHDVVRQSDVVLFVVDGQRGATHQEQRLAEEIAKTGSGLIILLNKWDDLSEDERLATEDSVADRLAFVDWAPVLRMSANARGGGQRSCMPSRRRPIRLLSCCSSVAASSEPTTFAS